MILELLAEKGYNRISSPLSQSKSGQSRAQRCRETANWQELHPDREVGQLRASQPARLVGQQVHECSQTK